MYFYPALGYHGRLGNQMFQYATMFSLAKMHGSSVGLPPPDESRRDDHKIQLYNAFPNLSAVQVSLEDMSKAKYEYVAKEGVDFNFEPSLFSARDDCRVTGYFQSENYFKDYRNDLKKEFAFSEEVQDYCESKLAKLKGQCGNSPICAVHFRRGDYTNLGHVHTNLGDAYYNPALSWMISNIEGCKFLVFSDDIDWCKSVLPHETFLFAETPSMLHDMLLMSMCDSHVIANSSFSWWGAWLSDNTRQVIAPKSWFGPEGPKSWSTIYCNGWGVI